MNMSEVNIDARLVEEGGAALSRQEEKLVEMSNGCICCKDASPGHCHRRNPGINVHK
jgi:G3E family GTPase